MRWFRFYSEVLNDPKVQLLPDQMLRHWINLLCIANDQEPSRGRGSGRLPKDVSAIAYLLHMGLDEAQEALEGLVKGRLIDFQNGRYVMHNWPARQPQSDSSTDRVRKHRATRARNVSVSPPEVEVEVEEIKTKIPTSSTTRARVRVSDPLDQVVADFSSFGSTSAGTVAAIEEAVSDYGLANVQLAVRKASGSKFDSQPPWTYVESILERWKAQGGPDKEQPRARDTRLQRASRANGSGANGATGPKRTGTRKPMFPR